tara:strand:+ start:895 stop:1125 length:231 start_codon:yes stop_codon:yes gene_type:complete
MANCSIITLASFHQQALTGKPRFAIERPPMTIWRFYPTRFDLGQVAEWLMAADCKSARESVRWFESSPVHHLSTNV